MARAGYRIFDADTHVIEPVEPVEAYLASADRAKLALEPLVRRAPARAGMSRYVVGKRPDLNRRLGSRERVAPPSAVTRGLKDGGTPWDVRWQGPPFPSDRVSFDPHARVKDMDIEGVDVNMILPSGGVPAFCGLDDVGLELAMYGIFPICPPELSLDDPDWEPIWAAAQEHDLAVIIHSFTMTVPYPPGMWDTWDNVFLQRSAGHVWNAQRNMAALIGAGVLDRYPELRLAPLECGHGWLAFWAARLDELAEMCRHALPPLKHKPSEYVRGPQYFQSIQLHEGELSVRQAIEALGEDTLMFATDFPHSESWFPKSVEAILGWTSISETAKRKLLWDNAARCYRRYGGQRGAGTAC